MTYPTRRHSQRSVVRPIYFTPDNSSYRSSPNRSIKDRKAITSNPSLSTPDRRTESLNLFHQKRNFVTSKSSITPISNKKGIASKSTSVLVNQSKFTPNSSPATSRYHPYLSIQSYTEMKEPSGKLIEEDSSLNMKTTQNRTYKPSTTIISALKQHASEFDLMQERQKLIQATERLEQIAEGLQQRSKGGPLSRISNGPCESCARLHKRLMVIEEQQEEILTMLRDMATEHRSISMSSGMSRPVIGRHDQERSDMLLPSVDLFSERF